MTLVSGTIPSLINGVSQQPPTVRLPSQGSLQINGRSSAADGLGKRPPTNHVVRLLRDADATAHIHFIDRDDGEKYIVVTQDGKPQVWDIQTGEKIPVIASAADLQYLEAGVDKPRQDLRLVTIADTTFVVNRKVRVKLSDALTPGSVYNAYSALIWVRQGAYNTTFTATVGNATVSYQTTAGTAGDAFKSLPDHIATELAKRLKAALDPAEYSVRHRKGDAVVWVYRKDAAKFAAEVKDSNANANTVLITDTIDRFDRLPNTAPHGMVVRVAGDVSSQADDYYVRFEADNGIEGVFIGRWVECAKPGIPARLDERTMPHLLERREDADGSVLGAGKSGRYFEFRPAREEAGRLFWRHREVGDEKTNPEPSLVGKYIQDVFFHRNRLGLIYGTNVLMSRVGDFFDFWRLSALTIGDDDPIDVDTARVRVTNLWSAAPFNEEILLFGDNAQLVLRGADVLSPKTVAVLPVSEYSFDPASNPVLAENVIFFANARKEFSDVYEYFVNLQSNVRDAANLALQIPRYIKGRVLSLSASPAAKMLAVRTDGATDRLYIYAWERNGDSKVMSSWSEWVFEDAVVVGAEFVQDRLYLALARDCGLFLERIDVTSVQDAGAEYITHLDRRLRNEQFVRVKYNSARNETTINLPYKPNSTPVAVTASDPESDWPGGVLIPVVASFSCDPPAPPPEPEPSPPLVSVIASEPTAVEGSYTGRFTFHRIGDISSSLTITVARSGTASHPADYTLSPDVTTTVTFAAGSAFADVEVIPVDDAISDEPPESVIFTIQPNAAYEIDPTKYRATVWIVDNDVASPPGDCVPDPIDLDEDIRLRVTGMPPPGTRLPYDLGALCNGHTVEWDVDLNTTYTLAGPVTDGDYSIPVVGTLIERDRDGNIVNQSVALSADVSVAGGAVTRFSIVSTGAHPSWAPFDTNPNPPMTNRCDVRPNMIYDIPSAVCDPVDPELVGGYVTIEQLDDNDTETVPLAPSDVVLDVDGQRIDVTWTDNSDNELGFIVERAPAMGGPWSEIARVGANITLFVNFALQANTQYCYRVRAFNNVGTSDASAAVCATTGGIPTIPNAEVLRYNTGEEVIDGTCGLTDAKWTFAGKSARLHYRPDGSVNWVDNQNGAAWISHKVDTSFDSEGATDRKAVAFIEIGGDFNLAQLQMSGEFAVSGRLQDILVNGVSTGIQYSAGDSASAWHPFSLPITNFQHGPNFVTFVVRSPGGMAANNPTGIIVKWTGSVVADLSRFAEMETQQRTVEIPTVAQDPCTCTHKLVLKGRWLSIPIWVGENYEFRYRFSPFYIRQPSNNSGLIVYNDTRLQVNTAGVDFSRTGHFKVEVTPLHRDTRTYIYSGRKIGGVGANIAEPAIRDGQVQVIVQSKNDQVNIDLSNNTFAPCWFQSAQWLGRVEPKARKV